jgi:hypothetical protein
MVIFLEKLCGGMKGYGEAGFGSYAVPCGSSFPL